MFSHKGKGAFMQQIGVVKEICGEFASVEVSRKSACEGCHANADGECAACVSFVSKETIARAENSANARIGDRVVLETDSGTVILYAAAVFVFPIILAIAGYMLGSLFKLDAAAYIGAILGFVLAFTVVWATLNKRASKRCDVRIVRIL